MEFFLEEKILRREVATTSVVASGDSKCKGLAGKYPKPVCTLHYIHNYVGSCNVMNACVSEYIKFIILNWYTYILFA